jgi:hypothetical protein
VRTVFRISWKNKPLKRPGDDDGAKNVSFQENIKNTEIALSLLGFVTGCCVSSRVKETASDGKQAGKGSEGVEG